MKHSESIISEDRRCWVCGIRGALQRHHCFGGTANRRLSEEDGLWIWLCSQHHTMSNYSVHQDRELDVRVKQMAQYKWEEAHNGDREAFRKRYGKSFL